MIHSKMRRIKEAIEKPTWQFNIITIPTPLDGIIDKYPISCHFSMGTV